MVAVLIIACRTQMAVLAADATILTRSLLIMARCVYQRITVPDTKILSVVTDSVSGRDLSAMVMMTVAMVAMKMPTIVVGLLGNVGLAI
jgi:hypothetical protein